MEKLIDVAKKVIVELIDDAEKAELERFKKDKEKAKIEAESDLEDKIEALKESTSYGYESVMNAAEEFCDSYREWNYFNIEERRIKDRWQKTRKEFGCLT